MNEEIKASVDSPAFRTEAEFAAYLDSLHETMPDGSITNRKWGPAQRALAGLAASRAMPPVTDSQHPLMQLLMRAIGTVALKDIAEAAKLGAERHPATRLSA